MVPEDKAASLLSEARGLDIFGDVHGHADALEAALGSLGYEELGGVWRHTDGRKALFLGDLIDGGPESRRVVRIVRNMAEHGEAVCIMGNHELNAVHFSMIDPNRPESHLRPRSDKNLFQHVGFLANYRQKEDRQALVDDLSWMQGLPLWVDLPNIRAIHACWSEPEIVSLRGDSVGPLRSALFWQRTADRADEWGKAVEVLLKGPEIDLPDGAAFLDKDLNRRTAARVKWWSRSAVSLDRLTGPPSLREALEKHPPFPVDGFEYDEDQPPLFFGHYWERCADRPHVTAANAQCLDFSVGKGNGYLGAYSWDGEESIQPTKLRAISADGRQIRFGAEGQGGRKIDA